MWFRRETSSTDLLHVCPLRPPVNLGDFFFLFDLLLWFVRACSYIIQVSQRWVFFFFLKRIMYTQDKRREQWRLSRESYLKRAKSQYTSASWRFSYLPESYHHHHHHHRTGFSLYTKSRDLHLPHSWPNPQQQKQQTTTIFIFQSSVCCVVCWKLSSPPALRAIRRTCNLIRKGFFSPFFPFLRFNSQSKLLTICLINVPIVF